MIIELRAEEESYIHMELEDIYISERDITNASNRTAVMHQFLNVMTRPPKLAEPRSRNGSEIWGPRVQPAIYCWISAYRGWEPEYSVGNLLHWKFSGHSESSC
jgi:hypothetical protein